MRLSHTPIEVVLCAIVIALVGAILWVILSMGRISHTSRPINPDSESFIRIASELKRMNDLKETELSAP